MEIYYSGCSTLAISAEKDELQSSLGHRLVGHTGIVESIAFSR